MTQKELYILAEDKQWLENRIAELEKQIQDLGPEFYDVFNQSSETWHDNAPFDALRDRQSVLFAEFTQLKTIRQHSSLGVPRTKKGTVGIGSNVIVSGRRYRIAGDWTPHAGKIIDETLVISAGSPLAQSLLGKNTHATTPFGVLEAIE